MREGSVPEVAAEVSSKKREAAARGSKSEKKVNIETPHGVKKPADELPEGDRTP